MDTFWRGLKGTVVGLAMAVIVAIAEPLVQVDGVSWPAALALVTLASFAVVSVAGLCAGLPAKTVRTVERIVVAAALIALTSPFWVTALRNHGVELPDLHFMPPVLVGSLGGAIVLLYEAGVAAQRKEGADSESCRRSTGHDRRRLKGDRLWSWVSLAAWLYATGCLLLPWWLNEGEGVGEFFGMLPLCLIGGGWVMLYFVGIPLRVGLNLAVGERRRARLWETLMCVVAFVVMSIVAYMFIWVYPPSSMGY
jgi:hypothetical protein